MDDEADLAVAAELGHDLNHELVRRWMASHLVLSPDPLEEERVLADVEVRQLHLAQGGAPWLLADLLLNFRPNLNQKATEKLPR